MGMRIIRHGVMRVGCVVRDGKRVCVVAVRFESGLSSLPPIFRGAVNEGAPSRGSCGV